MTNINMPNESEVVSRFLSTKNIVLLSTNEWLEGCIEWFKSQHDNFSTTDLQKFALQQWLLADLKLINHGSLPPNLSDINCIVLTGTYPMQINYFFNVGDSAYSQYEKMRKLCLDDQSVGVEKQANWMPKAKRMLKMEMTDGVQTIQGFEYNHLTKINESMEPGVKVIIKGPVECRKGVLLLKDINIEVLGGEVDTLCESNPTAHLIAEKLQLDPDVVITNINSNDNSNTQQFSHGNVRNETRTNITQTHQSQPVDERNLLDSDDDDIFLSVQPENEALNQNNVASLSNQQLTSHTNINRHFESIELLDDDIDDIPFENGDIYENNVASNLNNLRRNDRDWLDDDDIDIPLDDIEERTLSHPSNSQFHSSSNVSTTFESVPKQGTIKPSSTSTASDTETSTNLLQTSSTFEPSTSSSSVTAKNKKTVGKSDENIFLENTQTVHCKVEKCRTKLLVENGNWSLKVSLSITGQKVVDATFDPDVLNKIIGFSYAEMVARQKEIEVNPALKERFDKMLRSGQSSIKEMKCKMTLQRSSDSKSFTISDVDDSQLKHHL